MACLERSRESIGRLPHCRVAIGEWVDNAIGSRLCLQEEGHEIEKETK